MRVLVQAAYSMTKDQSSASYQSRADGEQHEPQHRVAPRPVDERDHGAGHPGRRPGIAEPQMPDDRRGEGEHAHESDEPVFVKHLEGFVVGLADRQLPDGSGAPETPRGLEAARPAPEPAVSVAPPAAEQAPHHGDPRPEPVRGVRTTARMPPAVPSAPRSHESGWTQIKATPSARKAVQEHVR